MYACWLGHGGPTDKENKVKMNKKYRLGTLHLRNSEDPDPYQNENSDPESGFLTRWSGSARLRRRGKNVIPGGEIVFGPTVYTIYCRSLQCKNGIRIWKIIAYTLHISKRVSIIQKLLVASG